MSGKKPELYCYCKHTVGGNSVAQLMCTFYWQNSYRARCFWIPPASASHFATRFHCSYSFPCYVFLNQSHVWCHGVLMLVSLMWRCYLVQGWWLESKVYWFYTGFSSFVWPCVGAACALDTNPTKHNELHLKVQSYPLSNVFTEVEKGRKMYKEPTGVCSIKKELAKV